MPTISIIVPVYKAEKYIQSCVQSILAQTYGDFELILMEDGSPDRSGEICDALAKTDTRIRVIHKENGGAATARNAGLDWMEKNSQSQFLAFVDADDCLHPQYLELLMKMQHVFNVDIAMCHYDFFQEEGVWFGRTLNIPAELDAVLLLDTKEMLNNFCNHFRKVSLRSQCMKLFKREIYKGVRMQEGSTQEDTLMLPWMLNQVDKIASINLPLYHWRETPSSISRSAFDARNFHYIDIAYSYARFFIERGHKQATYFKREFLYNSLKYYYRVQSQRPELMTELKPYIRLYKKHWHWIFTKNLCFRERMAFGLFLFSPKVARKYYMQVYGERYGEEYW
jgi:glycosyltransferase involved in cell wall biosynthesis